MAHTIINQGKELFSKENMLGGNIHPNHKVLF